MNRTENYLAGDGNTYVIHYEDGRYIVTRAGEIFTVGQQPQEALDWEDGGAHAHAAADIEARISEDGTRE